MNRAIVSVGTGRYQPALRRLAVKMIQMDPDAKQLFWDTMPENWPSHQEKPYGFKAYALREAATQADLLLWCDAAVIPVKPLDQLWEKIEKDGAWFAINGWRNYDWTADSAYPDLFPGVALDEAREINKQFTQIVGTAFGLNVRHPVGASFLAEYYRLASETNAFCGPWRNTNSPKGMNYCPEMMGECGPSDVLGHRHDQTAASVLAWRLGIKLTQCPSIFAYPPGAEDTILMAVGA